jgi:hypothetical protein
MYGSQHSTSLPSVDRHRARNSERRIRGGLVEEPCTKAKEATLSELLLLSVTHRNSLQSNDTLQQQSASLRRRLNMLGLYSIERALYHQGMH